MEIAMGWIFGAGCLAVLLLAGAIGVNVEVTFQTPAEQESLTVRLRIGFLRFTLLPKSEKGKKASKRVAPPVADPPGATESKAPATPKQILTTISQIRPDLTQLFGRLLRSMRLEIARLRIRVGTGDAATTALAYGAISQAVSYLLAWIDETFRRKQRKQNDFSIQADFVNKTAQAECKLLFRIRMWRLPFLGGRALLLLLKAKKAGKTSSKTKNKLNGGQ